MWWIVWCMNYSSIKLFFKKNWWRVRCLAGCIGGWIGRKEKTKFCSHRDQLEGSCSYLCERWWWLEIGTFCVSCSSGWITVIQEVIGRPWELNKMPSAWLVGYLTNVSISCCGWIEEELIGFTNCIWCEGQVFSWIWLEQLKWVEPRDQALRWDEQVFSAKWVSHDPKRDILEFFTSLVVSFTWFLS